MLKVKAKPLHQPSIVRILQGQAVSVWPFIWSDICYHYYVINAYTS